MSKLRDKEAYLSSLDSIERSWDERLADVPKNTKQGEYVDALIDKISQYADKLTRKEIVYMTAIIDSFETSGVDDSIQKTLESILSEASSRK